MDQARPTFYFKYTLLNWMRDELWLTRTRRRVTFFHLLCVLIPAAGIGTGIALGQVAHSLLKGIIWCAIGIAIGGVIAWLLPKLLWNMLHLFARKGWFLERQHPHATPMMTLEEFTGPGKDRNAKMAAAATGFVAHLGAGRVRWLAPSSISW